MGWDEAHAVAVDTAGAMFVAGNTYGVLPGLASAGQDDAFVRGHNSDGTERWTRQFGTDAADTLDAVAVDAAGEVLIAGSTEGALPGQASAGSRDAFLRAFAPDGTERWTRQFGTPAWDEALGVAVDPAGNVAKWVRLPRGEAGSGQTSTTLARWASATWARWSVCGVARGFGSRRGPARFAGLPRPDAAARRLALPLEVARGQMIRFGPARSRHPALVAAAA